MFNIAYAAGDTAGNAPGGQGLDPSLLIMMGLMFAIFYFLMIRPQQKKVKETRDMIAALKKGDRVITTGGIYGRITSLDDTIITLEVADRVRIKVSRGHVTGLAQSANAPQETKKS